MKIQRWYDALHQCQNQGQSYVLVTLLAAAGSTPRDAGTKMIVCSDDSYDTIGGGHLEYQVIAQARALLAKAKQTQHIEHYPLASKLGQCCGGATNVLFEVMIEHSQHLAIYGAGHVAMALVPILSQLPLQISWVDERSELFEQDGQGALRANNVHPLVIDSPADTISNLPANSWVLIMTHNHQLDFDLVCAALKREDIDYVGMIGSDTKARRFQTRLSHRGFSVEQIARLISPVGLTEIGGKKPIEVAVSIAGQLITRLQVEDHSTKQQQKAAWQHSKQFSQHFNGEKENS
jgi:xanthine dehydrogenase accessory factor